MGIHEEFFPPPWPKEPRKPKPTKKKRERMSTRRKFWLLGASLLILGVLMTLSAIPIGLVGVWSGDERWSVTGVILFFSGVFSGLIGGMTTDFNR